jgi:RNA 2',3'-cyclic 3'-phosphodiesterase
LGRVESEVVNDETVRAFVAIDFPDPIKERLLELARVFRKADVQTSWVRRENLHLTIRFLGDVDAARVPLIESALTGVCAVHAPFQLQLSGSGVFPNRRDPSVLWAGVGESEPLVALFDTLNAALAGAGFAPETRPYRPHITLARIREHKSGARLRPLLDTHADTEIGTVAVERVSLYASEVTPRGARHIRLSAFALGQAGLL